MPQRAQIFNQTLRDNILFGLPFEEARYNEVVECCCLRADIARLTSGDRTMIDALEPALDALGDGLAAAAAAARKGADATASMTRANAGRAAYIAADRLSGHVDPGAEAVARLFENLS